LWRVFLVRWVQLFGFCCVGGGGGLRLRVKPAMTCGGGKRQCGARRVGKNVPQAVGGRRGGRVGFNG
jgi:hypothetical protein